MNWDAIGAVGQMLGSLAVLLTLLYLAAQIRQNTRAVRGSTHDSIVGHQMDQVAMITSDPQLATAYAAALDDVDMRDVPDSLRASVFMHLLTTFRFYEDLYLHHLRGTLDPELWPGWRNQMLTTARQPGAAAFWRTRQASFAKPFREFLETNAPDEAMPTIAAVLDGIAGR